MAHDKVWVPLLASLFGFSFSLIECRPQLGLKLFSHCLCLIVAWQIREEGYPICARQYPTVPDGLDRVQTNILQLCSGLDQIRPPFSGNVA